MNSWQILITVMVLYWSDAVTGPILYLYRKYDRWQTFRDIKKETEELKVAVKEGKTTQDLIDAGMLHEYKPKPYVPPTKLETFLWYIKSLFWWRILEHPEDLRKEIKYAYQRVRRGWSNRDTWCFHNFLIGIIIGGLENLRKNKHGVPGSFCEKEDDTDEGFERSCKKWDEVLVCMINTFKTARGISEDHWMYQKSNEYNNTEAERWIQIHKKWLKDDRLLYKDRELKVMTKEECIEYEKGWDLFQEFFFSLWD